MLQKSPPIAGTISAGRIYSLEKAAAFLNTDTDTILEYAVQGTISLFVDIPDDVLMCSINQDFLKYHDPACRQDEKDILRSLVSGATPIALAGVEYLRLYSSDCAAIKKRGECNQAIYPGALHANAAQELVNMVLPAMKSSSFREYPDFSLSRCIACYARGTDIAQRLGVLKRIRITEDSVRVLGKDLNVLLTIAGRQSTPSLTIPFEDGFVEHAYMSKRLIVLHRAAVAFWNPNHESPATPTNDNIADWIQREYLKETNQKFGKTLAKSLVKIIRNGYENWDQTYIDKQKIEGKLSQFGVIVELSEVWKNVDFSRRDTYPSRIKEELVDVFNFPEDLAAWVVTLLRPEGASAGGRPKHQVE